MLSKKDLITWSAIAMVGCFSIYTYSRVENKEKVKYGYVEIDAVFEKFDLKQELEKELLAETSMQKSFLDSLMFDLQLLKSRLESKEKPTDAEIIEYQKKQSIYFENKQTIENNVREKTAQFDGQIVEQMTQYIRDYGVANNYDVVFGEDRSGNILYGDSANNITKEVIDFINNKYQGTF